MALATRVRRRKPATSYLWHRVAPYVFISPFYILFLIFGAFPIVFSGAISLTNWQGVAAPGFVGLANFQRLFRDPSFFRAMRNVAIVALGYQPIFLAMSLGLAVMLNAPALRLRGFFRTLYFLPILTSPVVVGIVFTALFDERFGVVNYALTLMGFEPVSWLTAGGPMRALVCLAVIWRWTGYETVVMLAGLQSISPDLYEAAKVDGAGGLQSFLSITVPLMRPTILFCLVMSTIGTFNLFDEPLILFGADGGNGQAALLPGQFLYLNAFQYFRFGYSSAFAWILGIILVVLTSVQRRLVREEL